MVSVPVATAPVAELAAQAVKGAAGAACCPAGLDEPLDRATAVELASLLKAVADPARLQILALLRASESGELCACDFPAALGLTQPTVSHHLKILAAAGLVARRQQGTWAHFRIVPERLDAVVAIFR